MIKLLTLFACFYFLIASAGDALAKGVINQPAVQKSANPSAVVDDEDLDDEDELDEEDIDWDDEDDEDEDEDWEDDDEDLDA